MKQIQGRAHLVRVSGEFALPRVRVIRCNCKLTLPGMPPPHPPLFFFFYFLCTGLLENTLGTRGNSLAKSGRPKSGETSVRSEVSEASERPNASSLWWRTPMVSLCLIQILYLITDWLFKNVFLPATAVGQKRSREMNLFFQ